MHDYDVIGLFFAGVFVAVAISYQIMKHVLINTLENFIGMLEDMGVVKFDED